MAIVSMSNHRARLAVGVVLIGVACALGVVSWRRGHAEQLNLMPLEQLRAEARRKTDDASLYRALAERLRQQGELTEAGEAALHAYNLKSDDPSTANALAAVMLDSNELSAASELIITASKQWPDAPELLAHAATLQWKLGRFTEAMATAKRATALGPRVAAAWQAFGNVAAGDKHPGEAWRAFDRARRLAPDEPELLLDYASALDKYGRPVDAEAALRSAMKLAPRSPRALGLLGAHLGEYAKSSVQRREAIALLRRATAIAPGASDPHYHLGANLLRDGLAQEAVAPLRKCLDLDPSLGEAHLALARAYEMLGRDEAAQEFREFERFSDFRREAAHLELRLRRQPKNRDLLVRMARLYEQTGQRLRAAQFYRRALAVEDDRELRHRMENLLRREP